MAIGGDEEMTLSDVVVKMLGDPDGLRARPGNSSSSANRNREWQYIVNSNGGESCGRGPLLMTWRQGKNLRLDELQLYASASILGDLAKALQTTAGEAVTIGSERQRLASRSLMAHRRARLGLQPDGRPQEVRHEQRRRLPARATPLPDMAMMDKATKPETSATAELKLTCGMLLFMIEEDASEGSPATYRRTTRLEGHVTARLCPGSSARGPSGQRERV